MKIKTKSKKVNKQWLQDHANDPYVKLAQKEGFRARAAYKLSEIDEQFKLLRPGQLVVDLGSTPGAWSQYIRRKFAPKAGGGGGAAVGELNGRIVALDLLEMEPIEGVTFIQGDFRDDDVLAQLNAAVNGEPVDVVVSDTNLGPRTVKILKVSKRGNHRPQLKTVTVLGNERVTAGGQVKRAKKRITSIKKKV